MRVLLQGMTGTFRNNTGRVTDGGPVHVIFEVNINEHGDENMNIIISSMEITPESINNVIVLSRNEFHAMSTALEEA